MLRTLVTLQKKTYNHLETREKIEAIAKFFAEYLSTYRPAVKNSAQSYSKHTRMGPVGKALSKMKAGKRGAALIGEIIRIHEMTSAHRKDGGIQTISPEGLDALTQAINQLSILLDNVSISLHSRIISEVDASVYYALETKHQQRIKQNMDSFKQFLIGKYNDLAKILNAWKEPAMSWNNIPYPSANYSKNTIIAGDIQEFLKLRSKEIIDVNEEEVDEE